MIRYLYHCDKNWRHDPNAEGERIKSISIAYQTLSDPELRHKYNQFGPEESAPEGGFVDPEEVFRLIFGGERFLPLIGRLCTLWFPPQMKTAVRRAYATEGGNVAAPLQRDVRESGSGLKVRLHHGRDPVSIDQAALCSFSQRGTPAWRSSPRICVTSSAFSQRMPLAQPTPR
jgi:DnaJ-class molecular chaperone